MTALVLLVVIHFPLYAIAPDRLRVPAPEVRLMNRAPRFRPPVRLYR